MKTLLSSFASTIGVEHFLVDNNVQYPCSVVLAQPYAGKIRKFACRVEIGGAYGYTYIRDRKPLI